MRRTMADSGGNLRNPDQLCGSKEQLVKTQRWDLEYSKDKW